MAFTLIHSDHSKKDKLEAEFNHIEGSVQDRQFTVLESTPNLRDIRDREIVIVSSGTYTKLMFRMNEEIFSINASCVTIRR
jgi:hypothetical protein